VTKLRYCSKTRQSDVVAEQERSHAISAKHRVTNLACLKSDFKIWLFSTHLAFFDVLIFTKSQTKCVFFQSERLGSGKTLFELHVRYKSLLTRVYDYAGCKEYCKDFTIALKMFDVFKKKQMYDSVITGKENASKDWKYIISMFLASFNMYLAFGYERFMCIYLKTAIWLFLGQGLAFLVKTGWRPWQNIVLHTL